MLKERLGGDSVINLLMKTEDFQGVFKMMINLTEILDKRVMAYNYDYLNISKEISYYRGLTFELRLDEITDMLHNKVLIYGQ